MSNVYVPQQPSKYDQTSRLWIPTINLEPAQKFGEVIVMLPPNANRLHSAPLAAAIKERMKDFCEDDYIVALGDPSLIAVAACIATKKTNGLLRMLKWDRIQSHYICVEMNV